MIEAAPHMSYYAEKLNNVYIYNYIYIIYIYMHIYNYYIPIPEVAAQALHQYFVVALEKVVAPEDKMEDKMEDIPVAVVAGIRIQVVGPFFKM